MRFITAMQKLFLSLFIACFWGASPVFSQDVNLANQYFSNGEYEKAGIIFGEIAEKNPSNDFVLNRYVECMLNTEQYDECAKVLKKYIKKTPSNSNLYVQYGNLLDRQGDSAGATTQYQKAIQLLSPDFNAVYRLANQFASSGKYDLAIQSYEQGGVLLKDKNIFALNLGELYRRKGDTENMITQYLNSLAINGSTSVQTVQIYLARYLEPADYAGLQTQLYTRIQETDNPEYIELLSWSFMQQKDYKNALRQLRALDVRLNENGSRVFKMAEDAAEARDYEAAIAGFDYIVQQKGAQSTFFFPAKQQLMLCRRNKITSGQSYSQEDLRALESDYQGFITEHGIRQITARIILEMAQLEALYINDLPKAISLLDTLVKAPGIQRDDKARAKINLADYYLMNGERWESTLLYSQVDKDYKEEVLGQEARFKNAKLAYYNGDFQWAQAQFDVLKASTSKLIANDALDLSVFIMDNLNLDTTSDAITLYAGAELLVFQNRFEEALARLDTLRREFPQHSLQDDIFYLQAQIAEKRGDYVRAAALFQKVADEYPEDIRADNALYALAQLYELRLQQPEKAQSLYEKIFMDYSGSVFAVDARKRFRQLRGDKTQ